MIEAAVKTAIAEQFGIPEAQVNLDSPLSDYDADSLDLVELVMVIEDETGVEIPDNEFDSVKMSEFTGRRLVELATQVAG
jgi:acyl carrier protein